MWWTGGGGIIHVIIVALQNDKFDEGGRQSFSVHQSAERCPFMRSGFKGNLPQSTRDGTILTTATRGYMPQNPLATDYGSY